MDMDSGKIMKIAGIILMVIGAGVAIWGYQLSGSAGSKITEVITGSDTDKVMIFYISGAVSFAVGLFLFIKK
ncbi:MAG: DUF3185 family protein [Thermodesulfobacteriota bacterium]